MNQPHALSQHFLSQLYTANTTATNQPILQILAFELSEHNPKEIIIRLSDGITFYDAILLGPYDVINNKIVVSPFTAYHGTTMEFKRFDIVKLIDYFNKIDNSKICRLKMMIRKIVQVKTHEVKIGRPEELAFYAQYNQLHPNHISDGTNDREHKKQRVQKIYKEDRQGNESDVMIKILDEEEGLDSKNKTSQKKTVVSSNKELQMLGIIKDRNPDNPLTVREVMNGYDGFFIGRLLRIKKTQKDGKEGQIPMLTLGFLDISGDILRINMIGKMAMREQKQLKQGRCYYIKGLQLVQTKGSSYIRLRQKDYKMHILNEQSITAKLKEEYYHWEHEYDYIQNENVDVMGIVDDIEQKTFYGIKTFGANEIKESKEVIRVVIRNKFKTVKVSFWSDQIKNLSKYNLKKGEIVMIEDAKKKKFVFLDYSTESILIKLSPQTQILSKFSHFLPELHEYDKPINIKQLYKIQEFDKYNTKVHTINAFLAKIHEEKMIFKICDLCKKKINIHSLKCFECKGNVMSFKYNIVAQFSDYSGSISVSVFDNVAEKLFDMSALRMMDIKAEEEQYNAVFDQISYKEFSVGIEIKNQRFILRSVQALTDAEFIKNCEEQIKNIAKILRQDQRGPNRERKDDVEGKDK